MKLFMKFVKERKGPLMLGLVFIACIGILIVYMQIRKRPGDSGGNDIPPPTPPSKPKSPKANGSPDSSPGNKLKPKNVKRPVPPP